MGYALDVHTVSSQFLGYDDFGKEVFETERSKIGQLLYQLKYQHNKNVIPDIVRMVLTIGPFRTIDVIVPVPSSRKNRPFEPVLEIAKEIGKQLKLPVLQDVIIKVKNTQELKNIDDFEERKEILRGAYQASSTSVVGKTVLLFDDLFRSGATLSSLTSVLYEQGHAKSVKVLTLTKTRSKL